MMIATERQRGALLAAVCSLAGVGLGFGLSQLAASNANCYHSVAVEHHRSAPPVQASVIPHTLTAPAIAKYTWLGVEGHTIRDKDPTTGLGVGAVVTGVFPGSPAAAAGLEPGAIITGVEGTPVVSFPGLVAAIRSHDKGDRVTVDYILDHELSTYKIREAEVTLGDISKAQFHETESAWRRR
jgi:S1-C subfamily serine protease